MDTYAVVGWPGGAPCSHPYHTDASYTRCYALTRHLYTPPPPPYMAVLATAATAPAAADTAGRPAGGKLPLPFLSCIPPYAHTLYCLNTCRVLAECVEIPTGHG